MISISAVQQWWATVVGKAPIGRRGERLAARYLSRKKYRILERNMSIGRYEADLVALAPDRNTIVVVEVKTRESANPLPELAINHTKQQHLTWFAAALSKRRAYCDHPIRFDVIAIIWPHGDKPSIRHYEGAFQSTT